MQLQGVTGKYAEITKGQLVYDGGIDLPQYYIVDKKIVDTGPVHTDVQGNWEVQVLALLAS